VLEDPLRNYEDLLKDFTDGYYKNTGELMRKYLRLLEEAGRQKQSGYWLVWKNFLADLILHHLMQ